MTFHTNTPVTVHSPRSHHHGRLGVITQIDHGPQTKNIMYQVSLRASSKLPAGTFTFFPGELIYAQAYSNGVEG